MHSRGQSKHRQQRAITTLRTIVIATHFPQTVAMVSAITVSAWLVGATPIRIVLVMLATLCGQVAVGWTNEIVDARTDSASGRTDKPVTRGDVTPRLLGILATVALALALPLSILAAGWLGGFAHILAVASALAYNVKLSRTVWSWMPYAVSFALLPFFVLQSAPRNLWPTATLIGLAACIGVIAHLFNALPDIERDRAARVGGLAVSLGAVRARILLVGLMFVGGAMLVVTIVFGWATSA